MDATLLSILAADCCSTSSSICCAVPGVSSYLWHSVTWFRWPTCISNARSSALTLTRPHATPVLREPLIISLLNPLVRFFSFYRYLFSLNSFTSMLNTLGPLLSISLFPISCHPQSPPLLESALASCRCVGDSFF